MAVSNDSSYSSCSRIRKIPLLGISHISKKKTKPIQEHPNQHVGTGKYISCVRYYVLVVTLIFSCLQRYVSEWLEIWLASKTEGDNYYQLKNLYDSIHDFLFANVYQIRLVAVLNISEVQKMLGEIAQNPLFIPYLTQSSKRIRKFEQFWHVGK